MPVTAGARFGPYEIQSLLGAGGMGEVYKAHDTRLNRAVAIKVLSAHVASDPNLRERFEREARAVAALNHPHICTLHDVGQQDGIDYLVMEYLEGQTLAARLEKGALPLDQVLHYAIQIADAVDKAHRQNIVHRDLKPGNVMLTKSGVKLLDFGLAKWQPVGAVGSVSVVATMTSPITAQGTIVGTLHYMAPEQVEGKEADPRSDIFAFGAIVYEMATGKRAFEGKSAASVMAAILERHPPVMSTFQPVTPAALDHLVSQCLAKDPDERWQSAGDLKRELAWIVSEGRVPIAQVAGSRKGRLALGAVCLVLGAALAGPGVWWLGGSSSVSIPVTRAVISVPPATPIPFGDQPVVALSPDGTRLVYTAQVGQTTQLFLRPMDQDEATPLPGTEGAGGPFFSPDGQWVAFFANDKLLKISLLGGRPVTICDVPARTARGGSWGDDGQIVFSPAFTSGLVRVAATGGHPSPVAVRGTVEGSLNSFVWPQVLPGSKAVLFTVIRRGNFDDARIAILSLESGAITVLGEVGANARYSASGHLIFSRSGALRAVPFEIATLKSTGEPVVVLDEVLDNPFTGAVHFTVSDTGSLVYVPQSVSHTNSGERSLVFVDRHGESKPLPRPKMAYGDPRLSPDGRRLAVTLNGHDVWVYDLQRGTSVRLTPEGSDEFEPVWTPDGTRVTFSSTAAKTPNLFWALADGSGGIERLANSPYAQFANAWTADGKGLIFTTSGPSGDSDTSILRVDAGDRKVEPFLDGPSNEWTAKCSPDGRWVAYVSDESGRPEVYVRPYPAREPKTAISSEGGMEPVWARSGRELFYRNGDRMMAVSIMTEPSFTPSTPVTLFEAQYARSAPGYPNYDVTPDGQTFVMIKDNEQEAAPRQLKLVVNWLEELKRRVPAK